MLNLKEREAQAIAMYNQGMENVKNNPVPKGQKFLPGARVQIAEKLEGKGHLSLATVKYTYAHAYGGTNVKSYCLDIDGVGKVSWYDESQLKAV